MKRHKTLLLAAAINGLLATSLQPAAAATEREKDAKIEQLERRLRLLEDRLSLPPATEKTPDAAFSALDQKVKILERQHEVTQEAAAEAAKTAPKIEVSGKGLSFSSADGNNSVRLRGAVQSDARFFVDDDPAQLANRFDLKQARVWVEGRFWKYNDFKIMPDFGNGKTVLADAYIDLHYFNTAALNVGRQKTPLSLERLQGDSDGMFLERAYPTYLASNRDNGIKLHGSFGAPGQKAEYAGPIDFKNYATYELGVFNGGGDNGGDDADKVAEDNKEVIGRLWAHPFQNTGIGALEGLGVGFAASYDLPSNNTSQIKNLKSALGQNTLVDYTKANKNAVGGIVAADGGHYRLYPQAYWYYGPYGLMGEYVFSSQKLIGTDGKLPTTAQIRQDNSAWQVQASYVLTGENATFQGVKPRAAFDPWQGKWGALQFAARWSELAIDKSTFQLLDPNKSITRASAWTVGANWFLNQNVLLRADYEQTSYVGGAAGGGNRPDEKVFATRVQLTF
jgi:phosphate-selective porin OprO/OprP